MGDEPLNIKPDSRLQAKIADVSKAIGEEKSEEQFWRAIVGLNRAAASDKQELVRQLIWYDSQATDVPESMTLSMVLYFLRSEVANIIEDYSPDRAPDFSPYRGHLLGRLERKEELEPGLVAHLFRRSPGAAIELMATTVYQGDAQKPLLWARHVIDDLLWKRRFGFAPPNQPDPAATEQLQKMIARDESWARAYAAAVIREHRELGTPDLVEKLKGDKSEVVRRLIQPDTDKAAK